jgi:hypothetical protein
VNTSDTTELRFFAVRTKLSSEIAGSPRPGHVSVTIGVQRLE